MSGWAWAIWVAGAASRIGAWAIAGAQPMARSGITVPARRTDFSFMFFSFSRRMARDASAVIDCA
ncbi:hypothetical protein STHU_35200 [Allostella humosa]|uniref:hypothetical protein n=1 Tax=Stella humosa TaxID=94 RepID=UPI0011379942|nr:hypothetical protein [Stella humosa]BBK32886.1 hypothetical protein STHU_35200 [Stella humosa]